MSIIRKIKGLVQPLIRNDCLLCARDIEHIENKIDFCEQCLSQFEKNLISCERCAIPTEHDQAELVLCGACQKEPPVWGQAVATFVYAYPVNKLLFAIKYQRRLEYFASLAGLMAKDLQSFYDFDSTSIPDCIVPVPLHYFRQLKRGYNQAELLALELSRLLSIPVNNTLIRRHRHTPSQAKLSKEQRQKNLHKAFQCKPLEKAKYIAVVDDVMTTGATAEVVCQQLLEAGAKRVDIWCLARADI